MKFVKLPTTLFGKLKFSPSLNARAGWTLLELLIALALVVFFLSFAISPFQNWLARQRQSHAVSQVVLGIDFARADAVRAQQSVTYCGSGDGAPCDGRWQVGQVILENDRVLQVFPEFPDDLQVTFQSSLGLNEALVFAADGSMSGQHGTFEICSRRLAHCSAVIVNVSGRVRVEE